MMKAVSQHIFAKLLPFVAEHEIGKCNMQFRQAKLFTLPLQVQVKWCLYWPVSTAWRICRVSCEQSVVMHVMMELQCWFLTREKSKAMFFTFGGDGEVSTRQSNVLYLWWISDGEVSTRRERRLFQHGRGNVLFKASESFKAGRVLAV